MSQKPVTSKKPSDRHIQRWVTLSRVQLPIFGDMLAGQAIKPLYESASKGNAMAAEALAKNAAAHSNQIIRGKYLEAILSIQNQAARNQFWATAMTTRSATLLEALTKLAVPATQPLSVKVFSLLWLENPAAVAKNGADSIPILIEMLSDTNPRISAHAGIALRNLQNTESIDALWQAWIISRRPDLKTILMDCSYSGHVDSTAIVYSGLLNNRLEQITRGSPALLSALVTAMEDRDSQISSKAKYCAANLQSQDLIDAFCAVWVEERKLYQEEILTSARYIADKPALCKWTTVCMHGEEKAFKTLTREDIPILVTILSDPDLKIQANARKALYSLSQPELQDALCQMVIQNSHPDALRISLDCNYRPIEPANLALFLFLIQAWEDYKSIDFDGRLLRMIYNSASSNLRQRITKNIQVSGRIDLLEILTGAEEQDQILRLSRDEIQVLVNLLIEQKQWDKLWEITPLLPLWWSVYSTRQLIQANFQPQTKASLFAELKDMVQEKMALEADELHEMIPPGIRRASITVHGRVNNIDFSPDSPILAIGTGQRKVVFWNYEKGELIRVVNGFNHSIGNVCFSPAGQLLAGERTNKTDEDCQVFLIHDQGINPIGTHKGSITSVAAVGNDKVLSTGRDHVVQVIQWTNSRIVSSASMGDWPRYCEVDKEQKIAAVLDDDLKLYSLPDLKQIKTRFSTIKNSRPILNGVMGATVFIHIGCLITGFNNGQVVIYEYREKHNWTKRLVASLTSPVRALAYLDKYHLVLAAEASGKIHFYRYPDFSESGLIEISSGNLTSMNVSRDGSFLSIGSNDSRMELFDLRLLNWVETISKPMEGFNHLDLAVLAPIVEADPLDPGVTNTAKYMSAVLKDRFQFDIHVTETAGIITGDFDIFIEGD